MAAFEKVAFSDGAVEHAWVRPYKLDEKGLANFAEHGEFKAGDLKHQLVFFLKPEATVSGVRLEEILEHVLALFAQHQVEVGALRVIGSQLLKRERTIEQHYAVINKVARRGYAALSADAKGKLGQVTGGREKWSKNAPFAAAVQAGGPDPNSPSAEVLGAFEFLEKYRDIDAKQLRVMNDNLPLEKLGPGTYAMPCLLGRLGGPPTVVLNAFHPFQLLPYEQNGAAIIVFELLSDQPFAFLRSRVCGATDPSQAVPGSLRAAFLQRAHAWRMEVI